MKEIIFAAVAVCCMASGCRSSKKTVESHVKDSSSVEISGSRVVGLVADSVKVNYRIQADSLTVKVVFDSVGRVKEKSITVKGVDKEVNKVRSISSEFVAEDSAKSSLFVAVENEKVAATAESGSVRRNIFWKVVSVILLGVSLVLLYRLLRG